MAALELILQSTVKIPNTQRRRPHLGFGLSRHTAQYYENEAQVGEAVREAGIPRVKIFITTKILLPCGGLEKTLERCRRSVKELGPAVRQAGREETWLALEKPKEEGGTRATEMKRYSSAMPAANQIELHLFCQQRPIVEYCKANGIQLEAYCPFAGGKFSDHPELLEIANEHNATPAQVLLRDHSERIQENADAYSLTLTAAEVATLDAMDQEAKGTLAPRSAECSRGMK
ncbi:NADP-dependent oxidoreductase domain-containing protein [Sphaerosporella brunnea]|uniref:NADP-dependent oxidoreductase domain-containing protein n=1 Tax=Sphaerosporella brunnea TaxID=1250544 RepID=A0A5J5F1Z0_9PEZI|nr:NADP-dependent oxidoreductase domain-containing protein [Sphaerosporella brunnea]